MPEGPVLPLPIDGPPGHQGGVGILKPVDFDSPMDGLHPQTSHFAGGFFAYWNVPKMGCGSAKRDDAMSVEKC